MGMSPDFPRSHQTCPRNTWYFYFGLALYLERKDRIFTEALSLEIDAWASD